MTPNKIRYILSGLKAEIRRETDYCSTIASATKIFHLILSNFYRRQAARE